MAKPVSHYLKNKLHYGGMFPGSYIVTDLLALENFIVNPPKTAAARGEFSSLKKAHREHYKELVKELQNAA